MCINRKKLNKFWGIMAAQLFVMSFFSGCSAQEADNDNIVIVEQESVSKDYKLAVATIDDVIKSEGVKCVYTQLNGQEVSFELSGKMISKVYVKEGDSVKKGQLLAELSSGNRESEQEQLEYQIARNKLLLEHAEENENFEISRRWLEYLYHSGQSDGEHEALVGGIEDLQRNYRYTKEDYQDAMALDEKQLEQLKSEARYGRVYASMDGTVMDLKENLEGSTSTRGEIIMTVMDNTQCIFVVQDTKYASYFSQGQEVDMAIQYGNGSGAYKLVPYEMDAWGESLRFSISESSTNGTIDPGTSGTIKLVMEKKSQVLSLPVSAVYTADDKKYVYVVGENNMREIKWIETGLEGDDKIEITSGLTEGEKVILR